MIVIYFTTAILLLRDKDSRGSKGYIFNPNYAVGF